ncbi:hypothetical protein BN7_4596 [Wickerhamomyces ciferrii]|uniref:Uncharacterized protein n=1 Tax=Wickerhamomyces ciferrii (strain ATCC 14091 / BCRC 22168 / CBS 111 / JCM 3599 / NBRC 0793 / NRRL Y-1031 F-60-10) TaxID=1206466 RepID=K0KSJ5_WICCF|nr:uncharacterized protein BN7_4596 [Wickerhamomyces ciferrii]CCH45017.1 hypothetical protein BN7_4596 [Wickerhamomyces ciferrii]
MSANSIIRVYQNTATTTANSSRTEISRYKSQNSPEYVNTPDSLVKDVPINSGGPSGSNTAASVSTSAYIEQTHPLVLHKIENLPTAPIPEESPQLSKHQSPSHDLATKTASSFQSMFTIPLKFFNSKFGGLPTPDSNDEDPKKKQNFDDDIHAVEDLIDELREALPIDIITESPVEPLNIGDDENSAERTNSELLKSSNHTELDQLSSSGYDPIYDTYISYLNYASAEDGELILDEYDVENSPETNYNGDTAVDNSSIVGNLALDHTAIEDPGNINDSKDEGINKSEAGSTLHRLSLKTLRLWKQLSSKYSSGPIHPSTPSLPSKLPHSKPQHEQSQPSTLRSELKRRISSVSIRRHNSSKRWKSTSAKSENDAIDAKKNENNSEEEPKEHSQPSTFRSELKRRLSNVSIRRHSSKKWRTTDNQTNNSELQELQNNLLEQDPIKPSTPIFPIPPQLSQTSEAGSSGLSKSRTHVLSKNQDGLAQLFESEDFVTRLSTGAVSSRKSYDGDYSRPPPGFDQDEDQDVDALDELYHISYRRNDDENDNGYLEDDEGDDSEDIDPTRRIRLQQTKAGQLNLAFHDTIAFVKDQTTRRSKSINQHLNRLFQPQEV